MDDLDLDFLAPVAAATTVDTTPQSDEPPDGDYDLLIEKATLKKNSNGRPMLSMHLRIEGPTQIRRMLFRHDVLQKEDPEKQVKVISELRTDLHRLGIEWGGGPDLAAKLGRTPDARCPVLEGKRFKGRKRTKGDYVNIYINGLIGEPVPVPPPGADVDPAVGF